MSVLASLRERNRAVWNRDVHLPDYTSAIAAADAEYIPALEARVEKLEAALREIAGDYCNFHTAPLEPWLPAEHGTCHRNGRTELRDERGGYLSCCHACFAAAVLGTPGDDK